MKRNWTIVPWTTAQIRRLREVAATGLTTPEIVKIPEFSGRTTNSIIGMCHRQKIPLIGRPDYTKRERKPQQKRRTPEQRRQDMINERLVLPPRPIVVPMVANEVSLLSVGYNQCRFMLAGLLAEDGSARVCGKRTPEGKNWCSDHTKIVYQPPK